jgi:TonB family protein
MTDAWKQQEGQLIDGQFRLIQYLGGTEHSAVFLTEFGDKRLRFAIKLIGADPAGADAQLARLRRAAKLSHPHLARIYQCGRAQVGSASVLYVITEYAEEDLAQILPDRALRPDEVRETLPQIIDTLQYLHSQGFVHARMKPSNILAVNDELKLSIDGVCAPGERGSPGEKASPYDPPELAPTGPSTAGDVWSLGMTLVEVLTQRLPVWEWTGHADPPAPRTLPAPFLEITRNCLRRDPAMRCTLREISENLDPPELPRVATSRSTVGSDALPAPAVRSKPVPTSQGEWTPPENPIPHRSNSRYIVQAVAFVLALGAVIAIPRFFRHAPKPLESDPVSAATSAPSAEQPKADSIAKTGAEPVSSPAAQPVTQPAPAPVTKSPDKSPGKSPDKSLEQPKASSKPAPTPRPAPKSAETHGSAAKSVAPAPVQPASKAAPPTSAPVHPAAKPSPAPAPTPARSPASKSATPASAAPSASPSPSAAFVRGQVAHKSMPDVTQRAQNTIRGKVRVNIRVSVDASGKVTNAHFEAPGPSKYFADAALHAAKNWTFTPPKSNNASVPSEWLLRFEFDPSTTNTFSAEINP